MKHFTSIFEELWRNGIDASDRIREIEGGIEEANIVVIHTHSLALDRYLDTVSSAKQDIFLIFPTTNAFIRHQRTGVFYLLREIVQLLARHGALKLRAGNVTYGMPDPETHWWQALRAQRAD